MWFACSDERFPPSTGVFSYRVTLYPHLDKRSAQVSPATPPPTMATSLSLDVRASVASDCRAAVAMSLLPESFSDQTGNPRILGFSCVHNEVPSRSVLL